MLPDVLGTLRGLGSMWRWAAEGVDDAVLGARPGPEAWSAAEYAGHSAEIVRLDGLGLAILLSGEDVTVDEGGIEVPSPAPGVRFADAVDRLEAELAALHGLVADVG